MSAYHDGIGLGENQALASRGGSAGAYGSKQYYPSTGWGHGYADDSSVDYTMCQPPFQPVPDAGYVGGAYRLAPGAPAASARHGGLVYVDAEAAYGYASVPGAAVRQSPSTEATCLQYEGMTPGVSRSLSSSTERLPAGRTLPSSGPAPYRTGDGASAYRRNSRPSSGESSASGSAVDVASSYHSYDSPQLSYGSQPMAGQPSRPSDVYAAAAAADGLLAVTEGALRTPVSGPEAGMKCGLPRVSPCSR